MPTYEFRCQNGHDFERFFKTMSSAPSELECPDCGAAASRQMSGGAGLVFKGSGFYLTDYGKNAHRKAAPETKSEGAKGDAGGGDTAKPAEKSESAAKPETKTESSTPKAEAPKAKPKPKAE